MSKEDNKKDKKDKKDEDDLGEVSYTYWKRDSDIKADHKGFQPQATTTPVNINVGSAWNQAGTWEEKTITKTQLESFFNDYIKKNKKEYKNAFVFDEFSSYSGEVSYKLFYFIIFLGLFCIYKRKNKIFL